MSDQITIKIETGATGGAPPNRKFRVSNTYEVKISPKASTKDLADAITKVAPEARVNANEYNGSKTVEEAGLKDGSALQFHNGMMD
jgi:hypothetical protein